MIRWFWRWATARANNNEDIFRQLEQLNVAVSKLSEDQRGKQRQSEMGAVVAVTVGVVLGIGALIATLVNDRTTTADLIKTFAIEVVLVLAFLWLFYRATAFKNGYWDWVGTILTLFGMVGVAFVGLWRPQKVTLPDEYPWQEPHYYPPGSLELLPKDVTIPVPATFSYATLVLCAALFVHAVVFFWSATNPPWNSWGISGLDPIERAIVRNPTQFPTPFATNTPTATAAASPTSTYTATPMVTPTPTESPTLAPMPTPTALRSLERPTEPVIRPTPEGGAPDEATVIEAGPVSREQFDEYCYAYGGSRAVPVQELTGVSDYRWACEMSDRQEYRLISNSLEVCAIAFRDYYPADVHWADDDPNSWSCRVWQ